MAMYITRDFCNIGFPWAARSSRRTTRPAFVFPLDGEMAPDGNIMWPFRCYPNTTTILTYSILRDEPVFKEQSAVENKHVESGKGIFFQYRKRPFFYYTNYVRIQQIRFCGHFRQRRQHHAGNTSRIFSTAALFQFPAPIIIRSMCRQKCSTGPQTSTRLEAGSVSGTSV